MTKMILILNLKISIACLLLALIININPLNNKFIHPTNLGASLIMFSMIISINLSMNFKTHWFSFITFLTIVSGMMVLFMYFVSFINNMKMKFKMNKLSMNLFITTILILMFSTIMMLNKSKMIEWINLTETNSLNNIIKENLNYNFMKINFIYTLNKNMSTIISMLYLFICMTLIVKICLNKKYSLRKMN